VPASAFCLAAKAVRVSARSVERASKVFAHGAPELVAAVETGALRLKLAEALASLPGPQQCAAVERAAGTGRTRTGKAARVMVAARSTATGAFGSP